MTHSIAGTGSAMGEEAIEGGDQKLVLGRDGRFLHRGRSNRSWLLS